MIGSRRLVFGIAVPVTVSLLGALGCSGESSKEREATGDEAIDANQSAAALESAPVDPVSGSPVTAPDPPHAIFLDAVYSFESEENRERFRRDPERYAIAISPVSGDSVPIATTRLSAEYGGRTWYFGTKVDMLAFSAEPAKYATYRCPGCGGGGLLAKPTTIEAAVEGKALHFCCTHCRDGFLEDPSDFFVSLVPEGGVSDTSEVAQPTE